MQKTQDHVAAGAAWFYQVMIFSQMKLRDKNQPLVIGQSSGMETV